MQVASISDSTLIERLRFRDLYRATCIELAVVALDVTARHPVVFHHERTPEDAVASAVVASCAIPLVIDPAFTVDATTTEEPNPHRDLPLFHRLVDGGAWSNYPDFVFKEDRFRERFGLSEVDRSRKVIGFLLSQQKDPGDPSAFVPVDSWPPFLNSTVRRVVAGNPLREIQWMQLKRGWENSRLGRFRLTARLLAKGADPMIAPWLLFVMGAFFIGSSVVRPWRTWKMLVYILLVGPTVFLGLRILGALRLSGLPTIRAILGANTGYPAWTGKVPGGFGVFLGSGKELRDLRSTDFAVPENLASILREAEVSCDVQLGPILDHNPRDHPPESIPQDRPE